MSSFASSLSTATSLGRIALGLGFIAAPSALGERWIGGVANADGSTVAVRGVGVRDVALGAATLGTLRATGPDGVGFAVLTALTVAVDLTDAASTWAVRDELPDAASSAGLALAAAAAGVVVLATRGRGAVEEDGDRRAVLEVLEDVTEE